MNNEKSVTKHTDHFLGYHFDGANARNLPYNVVLNEWGVSSLVTDWCKANCSHPWGQFFKEQSYTYGVQPERYLSKDVAVMTFKSEEEAILFKLTWVDK